MLSMAVCSIIDEQWYCVLSLTLAPTDDCNIELFRAMQIQENFHVAKSV